MNYLAYPTQKSMKQRNARKKERNRVFRANYKLKKLQRTEKRRAANGA